LDITNSVKFVTFLASEIYSRLLKICPFFGYLSTSLLHINFSSLNFSSIAHARKSDSSNNTVVIYVGAFVYAVTAAEGITLFTSNEQWPLWYSYMISWVINEGSILRCKQCSVFITAQFVVKCRRDIWRYIEKYCNHIESFVRLCLFTVCSCGTRIRLRIYHLCKYCNFIGRCKYIYTFFIKYLMSLEYCVLYFIA